MKGSKPQFTHFYSQTHVRPTNTLFYFTSFKTLTTHNFIKNACQEENAIEERQIPEPEEGSAPAWGQEEGQVVTQEEGDAQEEVNTLSKSSKA